MLVASVYDQILFGAANINYCVLGALAAWLEYSISQGWFDSSDYLFALDGLINHEKIKCRASRTLCEVLKDPDFENVLTDNQNTARSIDQKKTGTHSNRKYSTTKAKQCGCTYEEIDLCMRWKSKKRM